MNSPIDIDIDIDVEAFATWAEKPDIRRSREVLRASVMVERCNRDVESATNALRWALGTEWAPR